MTWISSGDDYPSDGSSADLVRRLAPERVSDGAERRITVDQTNRSVIVDESVIVKWLTPPVREPHHGLDLLAHLDAVGFVDMPSLLGVEASDGRVLAVVTEFVVGALDGWDWFVDALTDWVDDATQFVAPIPAAAEVGALAARLHLALATPSAIFPDLDGQVDVEYERDRCRALLAAASAEVTDRQSRAILADCDLQIRSLIETMPCGPTPVGLIHGDLHIGQVLRVDNRLTITDFDGNPLLDGASRRRLRPLAIDLAALIQSIDHAGRIAQKRRPSATEQLEPVISSCIRSTLSSYRSTLDAGGLGDRLDARLLPGLRAAQELHELVYAARHLPRWSYAPTATLAAMFQVTGDS